MNKLNNYLKKVKERSDQCDVYISTDCDNCLTDVEVLIGMLERLCNIIDFCTDINIEEDLEDLIPTKEPSSE